MKLGDSVLEVRGLRPSFRRRSVARLIPWVCTATSGVFSPRRVSTKNTQPAGRSAPTTPRRDESKRSAGSHRRAPSGEHLGPHPAPSRTPPRAAAPPSGHCRGWDEARDWLFVSPIAGSVPFDLSAVVWRPCALAVADLSHALGLALER